MAKGEDKTETPIKYPEPKKARTRGPSKAKTKGQILGGVIDMFEAMPEETRAHVLDYLRTAYPAAPALRTRAMFEQDPASAE